MENSQHKYPLRSSPKISHYSKRSARLPQIPLDLNLAQKYSSILKGKASSKQIGSKKVKSTEFSKLKSLRAESSPNEEITLSPEGHVNYDPTTQFSSEAKIKMLDKAEDDYLRLKKSFEAKKANNSISGLRHRLPKPKYASILVTQEEVNAEVKNSLIHENGREYYADLYLLKKGRDTALNKLSSIISKMKPITNSKASSKPRLQKMTETNQILTKRVAPIVPTERPEQKLQTLNVQIGTKDQRGQGLIYRKLYKQRSEDKKKMMKGKNLNWNVYYEMLALSTPQKQKLKENCKFQQIYGSY